MKAAKSKPVKGCCLRGDRARAERWAGGGRIGPEIAQWTPGAWVWGNGLMRGDRSFDMRSRIHVRLSGARLFEGCELTRRRRTRLARLCATSLTRLMRPMRGALDDEASVGVMGVDGEGVHVEEQRERGATCDGARRSRGRCEPGDKGRINAIGWHAPRKVARADPGPSPPRPSPASPLASAGDSPSDPPSHKPSSIAHPPSVPLFPDPPPSPPPPPRPINPVPLWTTTAALPLDVLSSSYIWHPIPPLRSPGLSVPTSDPITPTAQTSSRGPPL